MIDLDELKTLLASATPGEWVSDDDAVPWQPGQGPFDERGAGISVPRPRELIKKSWYERTVTVVEGGMQDEQGGAVGVLRNEDAASIVALHNAAPGLIAELEAAREVMTAANALFQFGALNHDSDCLVRRDVDCTCGLHGMISNYIVAFNAWKKARGEE